MPLACVVGSSMNGNVPHHANHITGWTSSSEDSPSTPIYCSGHSVTGTADSANQSKLKISGKLALVKGASGPSNDACDGSRFVCTGGSSSIFIGGVAMVLQGHSVELNPGSGTMVSANQSKFTARR